MVVMMVESIDVSLSIHEYHQTGMSKNYSDTQTRSLVRMVIVIVLILIPILMISKVVVIALMLISTVARMKFLTFNRERSGKPKVGKLAVALKF